ncbi:MULTISPECIES: hypothetical protein [Nonomuraea]|uniref:Uncharacterized protein n=1 Tax=Nonomuraea mangrovi TaxID=2316207 RepID=A0ABW4TA67_9ACTN
MLTRPLLVLTAVTGLTAVPGTASAATAPPATITVTSAQVGRAADEVVVRGTVTCTFGPATMELKVQVFQGTVGIDRITSQTAQPAPAIKCDGVEHQWSAEVQTDVLGPQWRPGEKVTVSTMIGTYRSPTDLRTYARKMHETVLAAREFVDLADLQPE